MRRFVHLSATFTALALLVPALASAHVIVTPNQVGVGASAMFNVSVPNEKQVAVTSVKLDIPPGVQDVQPDVLAGWAITTSGSGDTVTAITWTGNIPVGQRADFAFKAQASGSATKLDWKAYQTYADGTVVAWNQDPATKGEAVNNNLGPYSTTKVVNDLVNASAPAKGSSTDTWPLIVAIVALLVAIAALLKSFRRP